MAEGGDCGEESPFDLPWSQKIVYAGVSVFLVLFAGLVSGLSLGLMSLDKVDLMVSASSHRVLICWQ